MEEETKKIELSVLLFVSPTCPACEKLKTRFDEEGIDYDVCDVKTDEGLALASFHMVQSTPTTVVVDNSAFERRVFTLIDTEEEHLVKFIKALKELKGGK